MYKTYKIKINKTRKFYKYNKTGQYIKDKKMRGDYSKDYDEKVLLSSLK